MIKEKRGGIMKIYEIKNIYGSLMFSSSSFNNEEFNSLKDFVEFLVFKNAILTGADLSGANLLGSNLTFADLSCSNLTGANLSGSNLTFADLSCSNLTGASFNIFSKWNVSYTKNKAGYSINIGCKTNTIQDWDKFFSADCTEKFDTERDTYEFKLIKAHYESVRDFIIKSEKLKSLYKKGVE
jgi:hypothetical protein